ncbi:hypothetical protein J2T16_003772 [Paenibacillus intestini]|nr:hypothetical protein [Paenibacillus intestini]
MKIDIIHQGRGDIVEKVDEWKNARYKGDKTDMLF